MIGIGDDGKKACCPMYEKWIYESEVLSRRRAAACLFSRIITEKRSSLKVALSSLVERLQNETRNVVILASGDPLFFGIGSYLV